MKYGVAFCGGSRIVEVFLIQKRAVRIVAGHGWRDSCRGVFRRLDLLTLPALYIYECLCFVSSRPDCFDMLRSRAENRYTLRQFNINYPIHATALYESGCLYSSVSFYNSLPTPIRDTFGTPTFKTKLRSFLVTLECYNVSDFFEACRTYCACCLCRISMF